MKRSSSVTKRVGEKVDSIKRQIGSCKRSLLTPCLGQNTNPETVISKIKNARTRVPLTPRAEPNPQAHIDGMEGVEYQEDNTGHHLEFSDCLATESPTYRPLRRQKRVANLRIASLSDSDMSDSLFDMRNFTAPLTQADTFAAPSEQSISEEVVLFQSSFRGKRTHSEFDEAHDLDASPYPNKKLHREETQT